MSKVVFGNQPTTKTVTIHLTRNDSPVPFTIKTETSDGFFEDEIQVIINFFQDILKNPKVTNDSTDKYDTDKGGELSPVTYG